MTNQKFTNILKDSRTNYKYILIVVILAGIVGVGILYQWRLLKEEAKISEIEIPEKITEVPEGTEKQLTLDAIKNTEYHCLAYNKTVKLIDGSYTEKYGFETATVLSIRIYDDKIAFGDLDNDKKEDAAVILTSSGGGTGNFRELAIILNKDGEPSYLASKELGDRVIINSITIELGTIILDMIVHGPEDGLCCPSVEKTFKYKLSENQLVEIVGDETADWKTYRNEEYGYELKYPGNWEVSFGETRSGGVGVMLEEKGTEYFLIIFVDPMEYSSVEEVVKNWEKAFEEGVQGGIADISEEKINIDGNTGYKVVINMLRDDPQLEGVPISIIAFLVKDNYLFTMQQVFPVSLEVFNQVLSTIEFLE